MAKTSQVMLTCRIERPLVVALNVVAKKSKKTRSQIIREALLKIVAEAA